MIKKIILIFLLLTMPFYGQEEGRIQNIKNNLEALSLDNEGLTEHLKLDINVTNVGLTNFLLAVSRVHKININIDTSLQGINIINNFSNVTVADLLVFLIKEYNLDITFTGNILSIKKFVLPPPEIIKHEALVNFEPADNLISLDLEDNKLEEVFRKIIDESGENLLYNSGMENLSLSVYLRDVPFHVAMKKMAESNNLSLTKSRDGFYLFSEYVNQQGQADGKSQNGQNRVARNQNGNNFHYRILDTVNRILTVDFVNVPIANIINEISYDLELDVYTATPLDEAGKVSFKAKQIYYDVLLERMFESKSKSSFTGEPASPNKPANTNQNRARAQNTKQAGGSGSGAMNFTFKKENDMYFFGTANQLSVRKIEVIQMMHRSIELLADPTGYSNEGRRAGRTTAGNINYMGGGFQNNQGYGQNNQGYQNNQGFNNTRRVTTQSNRTFDNYQNNVEALVNILPDDIKADLDIKMDFELNSFLVSGPAANINRFKTFIAKIDKPVPVVLIEVMLIEVKKSASVETGISWGIGDEPAATKGKLFPEADLTLGAKTVNKIIGGFDGFGSFNIGKVVPDFFTTIKAMEENGHLKIRSTPKLSTLNGHRARLSIGETTYYVVTNQNFFGSQIPTASEVRNYQPIDAELAVSIKPLVSGNGQVTLEINVIQSDFNGERIEAGAPPGLTSREFSSIVRMQDQDLAVLGGLEEKVKNDSGSGVPLLSRIPIIKWLFSKRKRVDSKQKLTILIKPTVIY